MVDHEESESQRESRAPGATRRGVLRGAAGLGVAGLTAGMLGEALARPAHAATVPDASAQTAAHDEPLVLHIHDARTGVIDLYSGTRHVRITDRQLAARLAQASR